MLCRPLLFAATAAVCFAADVRTDFEGGSAARVEKVSDTHFRIAVNGEVDQNRRNRQASWYYFRVDNAPRGEMVFDMVDLPGEYNFQPNRGAITKDTPPLISSDGKTWTHVTNIECDAGEARLRIRATPPAARFWIAHTPPYTSEHLDALRREIRTHKAFREEIAGKTAGGRPMYLWTIGAGKKTAWLMFRQHAWESGSSWAGEGAVRELLANEALRRDITWKIFPMCDPDGVARGGVRFNVNGFDLNRNWDALDAAKMPEIAAQHRAIAEWIKPGRSVDLFLTVHNTETAEYLQAGPESAPVRAVGERFFNALAKHTTFEPSRPLSFGGATTTEGMRGRMTVVQGLAHDFKIPAFLIELRIARSPKRGTLPGVRERLEFGRGLARAIAATLE